MGGVFTQAGPDADIASWDVGYDFASTGCVTEAGSPKVNLAFAGGVD